MAISPAIQNWEQKSSSADTLELFASRPAWTAYCFLPTGIIAYAVLDFNMLFFSHKYGKYYKSIMSKISLIFNFHIFKLHDIMIPLPPPILVTGRRDHNGIVLLFFNCCYGWRSLPLRHQVVRQQGIISR